MLWSYLFIAFTLHSSPPSKDKLYDNATKLFQQGKYQRAFTTFTAFEKALQLEQQKTKVAKTRHFLTLGRCDALFHMASSLELQGQQQRACIYHHLLFELVQNLPTTWKNWSMHPMVPRRIQASQTKYTKHCSTFRHLLVMLQKAQLYNTKDKGKPSIQTIQHHSQTYQAFVKYEQKNSKNKVFSREILRGKCVIFAQWTQHLWLQGKSFKACHQNQAILKRCKSLLTANSDTGIIFLFEQRHKKLHRKLISRCQRVPSTLSIRVQPLKAKLFYREQPRQQWSEAKGKRSAKTTIFQLKTTSTKLQLRIVRQAYFPKTIPIKLARWSSSDLQVQLQLIPVPFWKRWWFWTSVGVVATGTVAFTLYYTAGTRFTLENPDGKGIELFSNK